MILAYHDAFNRQDVSLFGAVCAVDPEAMSAAEQAMRIVSESGIRYQVRDIGWDVISYDEDTLRVKTYYHETISMNGEVPQERLGGGWLTLIQEDGEWYVLCFQP